MQWLLVRTTPLPTDPLACSDYAAQSQHSLTFISRSNMALSLTWKRRGDCIETVWTEHGIKEIATNTLKRLRWVRGRRGGK
jgi:hypothetical protein